MGSKFKLIEVEGVETRLHTRKYTVMVSKHLSQGEQLQALADHVNGHEDENLVRYVLASWINDGVIENMTAEDFDEATYKEMPT